MHITSVLHFGDYTREAKLISNHSAGRREQTISMLKISLRIQESGMSTPFTNSPKSGGQEGYVYE